jgi:hypothetical protein
MSETNGQSLRDKVLELAKESNPRVKNMAVESNVDEFLDGQLFIVSYTDAGGQPAECLVYAQADQLRHFSSTTEMARYFGSFQRRSAWHTFIRSISTAGMPGLLAFIILLTICFLSLTEQRGSIPDILANALTVILGFYFGRHGGRNSTI